MIAVRINDEAIRQMIQKLVAGLTPDKFEFVAESAAARVLSEIVPLTPKKWFGQVRRSWKIENGGQGIRRVVNPNKIMRFLEFGTANGGQGFITPVRAKMLYIPLTRRAATGWKPSLKPGKDYILRRKVRGIKPRKIVSSFRPRASDILREQMMHVLRQALPQS